jgi:hypothetical protein
MSILTILLQLAQLESIHGWHISFDAERTMFIILQIPFFVFHLPLFENNYFFLLRIFFYILIEVTKVLKVNILLFILQNTPSHKLKVRSHFQTTLEVM